MLLFACAPEIDMIFTIYGPYPAGVGVSLLMSKEIKRLQYLKMQPAH